MSQSLRASGTVLARLSSRSLRQAPRRAFTISAIRSADTIQNLYIQALRDYKPTPPNPEEAKAATKAWNPPPAPKSPEETNLASEMTEYENSIVEVEGQAATGETQEADTEGYFDDIATMDGEPEKH